MSEVSNLQTYPHAALDSVLASLVLSAGASTANDIPTDAIDAALSIDPVVQTARQALDVALRGLDATGAGDGQHQAVLRTEEAVNALVVASMDAAYRVGVGVGRSFRE